eukprot:TRINITY_DN32839_c0_g1_i1.p1 TRINITY_DN32839_c0_g1~~TRINITY_DN32839_c0_g1_i1.p1  ORF type:complete len:266 (-),score=78.49 TRINITY_DN32839_c0_g1_i1:177-974(-)
MLILAGLWTAACFVHVAAAASHHRRGSCPLEGDDSAASGSEALLQTQLFAEPLLASLPRGDARSGGSLSALEMALIERVEPLQADVSQMAQRLEVAAAHARTAAVEAQQARSEEEMMRAQLMRERQEHQEALEALTKAQAAEAYWRQNATRSEQLLEETHRREAASGSQLSAIEDVSARLVREAAAADRKMALAQMITSDLPKEAIVEQPPADAPSAAAYVGRVPAYSNGAAAWRAELEWLQGQTQAAKDAGGRQWTQTQLAALR